MARKKKFEAEAKENLKIWEKYEKCKNYIQGKGLKEKTERNWNFYLGRQWYDAKHRNGELEINLISKNFIKPTVRYKVATIAQHSLTAIFSDLGEDNADTCTKLSQLFDISWEKAKMDRIGWRALRDSAVAGDSYVYFGEADTRSMPQILLNMQVLLGDENITDIQEQPYLIIEERVDVAKLKRLAKENGVGQAEIDMIRADKDSEEQIMNREEVDSKTTAIVYMEKKDGIVNIARAVKNCVYEPLHPIQQDIAGEYTGRGLTMYPIIPVIWETQPNNARGISEVETLIPNQLELNKTLVRRSISIKQTAYSKLAVDENSVSNPDELNKVGGVIKLNGGSSQAVNNMISYLNPANQSPDAKMLSDELLADSRELAGASDVMMGNYNPARVSGTAIASIREQQTLPMNEQIEMYKEFVEEVAQLYFEMWVTFNPVTVDMGEVSVDTESIRNLIPNVRIDISENNALSKVVEKTSLDNLLQLGAITFEEYVELLPDHSDMPKKKLEAIVAKRQQMQMQQQQAMGGGADMQNTQQLEGSLQGEQPLSDMYSAENEGDVPEATL
jgi:hypothetical protein